MVPPALKWENNSLYILNQKLLPHVIEYIKCEDYEDVAKAIKEMVVRGAPAIGIAAAYGVALGLKKHSLKDLDNIVRVLSETRPTAVNLFWALERIKRKALQASSWEEILEEAKAIHDEDVKANEIMGNHGATLVPDSARILTHCNAGALATGGLGTALGVIRMAYRQGKKVKVFVSETRPVLQGARLTTWELMMDGIDVTLITDNMAGYLMSREEIDLIIVGADRIASNGDVANKIGTYSLAVLAKFHGIPFYVAAPTSTIDMKVCCGKYIPIEERDPREVKEINGVKIAPVEIKAYNPAFDITPANLISAIITEKGIIKPPFEGKLYEVVKGGRIF
ncbi:MAG: S-methyl-5-thioribose-1-phosphate isomerase [Synergistetes bacterium]|nr:S-methyl-5-thioribose-1-phosphate isomerase [Synergistota bacterium]MCX8128239.1 S-methyl-5-thioribose-1-phosphate isomerase [Synergistota bacterium]MDW8192686.1 S-methyl-5-thioribose-1-phosphate isomerase [Synergistota bacterium]